MGISKSKCKPSSESTESTKQLKSPTQLYTNPLLQDKNSSPSNELKDSILSEIDCCSPVNVSDKIDNASKPKISANSISEINQHVTPKPNNRNIMVEEALDLLSSNLDNNFTEDLPNEPVVESKNHNCSINLNGHDLQQSIPQTFNEDSSNTKSDTLPCKCSNRIDIYSVRLQCHSNKLIENVHIGDSHPKKPEEKSTPKENVVTLKNESISESHLFSEEESYLLYLEFEMEHPLVMNITCETACPAELPLQDGMSFYLPKRTIDFPEKIRKVGKKSKLQSNVYVMANARNFKKIWRSVVELADYSDWENLLKLTNPLLITLKIAWCIDRNTCCITATNWSTLNLISLSLAEVHFCKYDFHKALIINEFLNMNFIAEFCNLICDLESKQWGEKEKKAVLSTIYNFLSFYEEICIYYNHMITDAVHEKIRTFISYCSILFKNYFELVYDSSFVRDFERISSAIFEKRKILPLEVSYPVNCLKYHKIEKLDNNEVHNYLLHQIMLLKEDFESCLRDGIRNYIQNGKDMIVFHNVTLNMDLEKPEFSFAINFGQHHHSYLTNTDWLKSNMFLQGSIILLTNNGFKNYYFALVTDRTPLENGNFYFYVSFVYVPQEIELSRSFSMAVPDIFFEPYHRVTTVLRSHIKYEFPFWNYIIKLEKNVAYPRYLKDNTEFVVLNKKVDIHRKLGFPDPLSVGLNESQMDCIIHALTNEFSLILGPPGTGKTFLCTKLIQILLKNKGIWSNKFNTPIVVVCYKNVSLDELLTGLLKVNVNVLRIGNRTESEELSVHYCLKGMDRPKQNWMFTDLQNSVIKSLKNTQKLIRETTSVITAINENKGLLNLDRLTEVVTKNQFMFLSSEYFSWLMGESYVNLHLSSPSDIYGISTNDINNKLSQLKQLQSEPGTHIVIKEIEEQTISLIKMKDTLQTLLKYIKVNKGHAVKCDSDNLNLKDMLSLEDRWDIYIKWVNDLRCLHQEKLEQLIRKNCDLKGRLREILDGISFRKISQSNIDVIGMTTTAAARLHKMLDDLKVKIVIVEEAAEVIESHIIASIGQHCEHLVLFGDHKQLRPMASNKSSGSNGLDYSLFERLVDSGFPICSLKQQYRMRPEICELICPAVYPFLINDQSVFEYGHVKGVTKDVFFLHHTHQETKVNQSYSNMHEAQFLLAFAEYLIKQGYKSKDITIIAAYSEQERLFHKLRIGNYKLKELIISTLDAYQGKENLIVLISLVRNNKKRNTGFLDIENRVCVALSRAKLGLFILGNMQILCNKDSIWNKVERTLELRQAIGRNLALLCSVHNEINEVSNANEIESFTFGGCKQLCEKKLNCGHTCTFLCHPIDLEHNNLFKCTSVCGHEQSCGHNCEKICHTDMTDHCDSYCDNGI